MSDNNDPNSGAKPRRRGVGRPFPKGVSGNPGGRRATPPEVREAFRTYSIEALRKLVEIMRTAPDAKDQFAAAAKIIAYSCGTPPVMAAMGDEDAAARDITVRVLYGREQ